MGWVTLVEMVIDMRVSVLFTNLLISSTECDDNDGEISQTRLTDYEKQYRFLTRMVIKSS